MHPPVMMDTVGSAADRVGSAADTLHRDFNRNLQRCFDDRLNASPDDKKMNRGCLVAKEKARSSKCKCIFGLCTEHRDILSDAFTTFLRELDSLPLEDRRSFVVGHLYNRDKEGLSLNSPSSKDFMLIANHGGSEHTLTVCRNAMITMTRRCLGYPWKDTTALFKFPNRAPKSPEYRKKAVMEILQYLLQQNYAEHTNVDWRHEDFLKLGYNLNTTKKQVRDFSLREIAHSVIRSVVHHQDWLRTFVSAIVVVPDEAPLMIALKVIHERATVVSGYDYAELHQFPLTLQHAMEVDTSQGEDEIRYTESVQTRRICLAENARDKGAVVAMEVLKGPIAAALSCLPSDIFFKGRFVKSIYHDPQPPFTDMSPSVTDDCRYRGKTHVAIIPLTKSGCFQQLWSSHEAGRPAEVVFVPEGAMLILPGDCARAGGFQSSPQTQDLTLELVVLQDSKIDANRHQLFLPASEYPHSLELNFDGKLERAFNCDITR